MAGGIYKIPRHPLGSAAGPPAPPLLSGTAAIEICPAFTRLTDISDREPLIVGHRYQSSLSIARVPFDPNLLRIHGFVGFEVIQCTARRPVTRGACYAV